MSRIALMVPDRGPKRVYLQRFVRALRRRPIPSVLFVYALRAAMHYHGWKLARAMQIRQTG
jgi:hypothetical protein